MVNPTVKKHFLKYGLPASVLQSINGLVSGSIEENATEAEIIEACKIYETLAKNFQSEVDRAKAARNERTVENAEEEAGASATKNEGTANPTEKLLAEVLTRLDRMESDKTAQAYNTKATERLKALKMSDSEIAATMYGRKFTNEEEVEDFVGKQEEFFADILKARVEEKLDGSGKPPVSKGSATAAAFKSQVESFNERY